METVRRFGCLLGVLLFILGIVGFVASMSTTPRQSTGVLPTAIVQAPSTAIPSTPASVIAQATLAPTPLPEIPSVGSTLRLQGWQVALQDFGPYGKVIPGSKRVVGEQGILMVASMAITNIQNATSNFTTNDFVLSSGDGRQFSPTGDTATVERGFMISKQVQPGLTSNVNVVFEINAGARDLTLTALKMKFRAPWSDKDQNEMRASADASVTAIIGTATAEQADRDSRRSASFASLTAISGTLQALSTPRPR